MRDILASVGMWHIASMYALNSDLCELMNAFMGSIQGSLLPKVDRLARHCRDLAISVNVRTARGLG